MYEGVPIPVSWVLEIPKSVTLGIPSSVNRIFWGLISLCMNPFSWAWNKALQTWIIIFVETTGSNFVVWEISLSKLFGIYSITIHA